MDHFLHPRNIGKMEDYDGFAEVGNPVCGDQLSFYVKVKDGKIEDQFNPNGSIKNIAGIFNKEKNVKFQIRK